MRKLQPPKAKGSQKLEKQTIEHYKGWFQDDL
jgi:hypothetical protein